MNDNGRFRILIVEDEPVIRSLIKEALSMAGYGELFEADCADAARKLIKEDGPFDLLISDIRMPGDSGMVLLREMAPLAPDTVAVMVSGIDDVQVAVQALQSGAYDYVLKPFSISAIQLAVGRTLRRRQLEIDNRNFRAHLEDMVRSKTQELDVRTTALVATRHAMLRGLCRMAEFRHRETGAHLERMAVYSVRLARQLQRDSAYSPMISDTVVENLFESAPLHDIGKVGIEDAILLKPCRLTPKEFNAIKRHTTIGLDIMKSIKSDMGELQGSFIDMAIEVVSSHHEHWDGNGYPRGIGGNDIPLSARIVTLADVYDACRSSRVYRPEPLPREQVIEMIEESAGRVFDPVVVEAFQRSKEEFIEIEGHMGD